MHHIFDNKTENNI